MGAEPELSQLTSSQPPLTLLSPFPSLLLILYDLILSQPSDPLPLQKLLQSPQILHPQIRLAYPQLLIPLLFSAMLRNITCPIIQQASCHLLQHITATTPTASQIIAKARGIQLLVHITRLHKSISHVQAAALHTLANVCDQPNNRRIAAAFFAMEAITTAARTHDARHDIQLSCLRLLTILATDLSIAHLVHRYAAASVPIRILKRHSHNLPLCRSACACLAILLARHPRACRIASMRPVTTIVDAVRANLDDQNLQQVAFTCLRHLVANQYLCTELANANGAVLAVRNLRRFRGEGTLHLHQASLSVLEGLAREGMERKVLDAGGVEASLACMLEWRTCFDIQVCGFAILGQLLHVGEELLLRVSKAQGTKVLGVSLKIHIRREKFVNDGVRIFKLLRNPSLRLLKDKAADR